MEIITVTRVILDHNNAPGPHARTRSDFNLLASGTGTRSTGTLMTTRLSVTRLRGFQLLIPEVENHVRMAYVKRWDPYAIAWPPGSLKALGAFIRGFDPT